MRFVFLFFFHLTICCLSLHYKCRTVSWTKVEAAPWNILVTADEWDFFFLKVLSLRLAASCETRGSWDCSPQVNLSLRWALFLQKPSTMDNADRMALLGFMQHVWVRAPVKGNEVLHQSPKRKRYTVLFLSNKRLLSNFLLFENKTWLPNVPENTLSLKVAYLCECSGLYCTQQYVVVSTAPPPPFHAWLIGYSYIGCNRRKSYSHLMWL